MQYLKVADGIYYNTGYIDSVIEGPYIGIKRQVTVGFSTGRSIKLVNMTAAMFFAKLKSEEEIIDVSASYERS